MNKLLSLLIVAFWFMNPNRAFAQEKEYHLNLTEWDFARLGEGMGRWIWPSEYKIPQTL
jgi:hypothetical protein